jgi:hypothetical protein
MRKIYLTAALLILLIGSGYAQQKHMFGISYKVNIPTNDYLTKVSWAGGDMDYRYFTNKDWSFGANMAWMSYSQYFTRQTYTKADGNVALTSDFVAHAYTLPLTLTAYHYFPQKKMMRLYAGVGAGAQYMDQRLYYNVYESDDYNWGFIARPEIGVLIGHPDTPTPFVVAVDWSYATNKNGITQKSSFTNFGIKVGVLLQ